MRSCASNPDPVDTLLNVGPKTKARLWSMGIRSVGELRDAVDEALEFGTKMPPIKKDVIERVLTAPADKKWRTGASIDKETPATEAAEAAWGFNNVVLFLGSTVQGRIFLRSPNPVSRAILARLGYVDFKTVDNFDGGVATVPVEHKMKQWHGVISDAFKRIEQDRSRYILGLRINEDIKPSAKQRIESRFGGSSAARRNMQMDKDAWYNAITETLENGGQAPKHLPEDARPHLEEAAKKIRDDIWEPARLDMEEIGHKVSLDPMSYVMRVYDADLIRSKRMEFIQAVHQNRVKKWTMKYGQPASHAMSKDLYNQVVNWTESILSTPHSRAAKNLAEEDFADNASNFGRMGGERTIDVDQDVIAPFLRRDIREIMSKYMNTRIIDMEIVREFGDIQMNIQFEEMDFWYANAIRNAPNLAKRSAEKAIKRIPVTKEQLRKQQAADRRDLELTRDILRGMLDIPADPYTVLGRTERLARAAKDINYIRLGGGFALTAVGDIGGAMLVNGIRRTMLDMHQVMANNIGLAIKKTPLDDAEMRALHLDWLDVMNLRGVNLFSTGEYGGQGYNVLEKGLHVGSRKMAQLSLLSNWTNFAKQIAARGVVRRMIDVAERAEVGKATPDELAVIGNAYMSPHKLQQMLDMKRIHGGTDGNTSWLGLDKWGADAPDGLLELVRDVIIRETDRAVLTPGATDAPIFMHRLGGSLLFQFRRFGMSHTQRLLVPAMQSAKAGDMQILNALAVSSAMGSIVYTLKEVANKREIPTDINRIIQEGVVRSDLWGKLGEVDGWVSATTGGVVGLREFLGPSTSLANSGSSGYLDGIARQLSPATYSTIIEAGRAIQGFGGMLGGGLANVSEENIRAWRRVAPFNTLFYLDWWFDMLENGLQSASHRGARKRAMIEGLR